MNLHKAYVEKIQDLHAVDMTTETGIYKLMLLFRESCSQLHLLNKLQRMDGLKKELRKMKENQKFSFKTLRESVVNSLRILIKPSNKASEVLFEDESTP